MMKPKVAALIVAAGRGERAGGPADGPKQFRAIGGQPVLRHVLTRFQESGLVDTILVVIHPEDIDRFRGAIDGLSPTPAHAFGGSTRQESVRSGLHALSSSAPDIVLIHDGARPFIEPAVINRVIEAVGTGVGALPVLPVSDTIKRVSGELRVTETVDRANLFAAQTPQGFPYAIILEAHMAAAASGRRDFTDDASIAEWRGIPVMIVEGSAENIKLTLPGDIQRAEALLRKAKPVIDVRIGNGYDVHQLVAGDAVTLCGVEITHDRRLLGHSDADVGLHALTDALLATCGAGDIGTHFPPTDPQWRGAASHVFVRHAVEIVRANGGRIANADITLICEAPKVAPHREAMRAAVAEMTGLELPRISVKATTNEALGFVGRREGIAAIATASVVFGDNT